MRRVLNAVAARANTIDISVSLLSQLFFLLLDSIKDMLVQTFKDQHFFSIVTPE
jgi:hypothetical protein